MNSKPKILIIENSIAITGALKSIVRTSQDLNSFFDFSFVIPQKSKGRYWIEKKGFLNVMELPLYELSKRFKSIILYLPFLFINAIRLNRIVKQQRIDIVHVNDIYNLLPLVTRLLGNSTPYICHIRFMPDRFPSLLFRFWLKLHLLFAAKIITVSKAVKRQLPNHPKIVVIYNELPTIEQYLFETTIDELKVTNTFLYLSNFMIGKGQEFALKAFSRIHDRLPGWKLRLVGDDMGMNKNKQYLQGLQMEAIKLGIDKKIEWKGFTEEVEIEYKAADIVLNFSESESFSITCLEALYFGRPLIATNCGGPAEIIDDNITGLLVANRSIDEMAKAMETLANNAQLRLRLGLAARDVVRNKFSLDKTSLLLREEYKKLLKNQT